jgi:hypothetical protein
MNIEVFDNLLDDYVADRISHILHTAEFPWYFHDHIAYKTDNSTLSRLLNENESLSRYQFVHTFKSNINQTSSIFFDQSVLPIIDKLKINFMNVCRAKVNLSVYTVDSYKSAFHIDSATPHKVALYYVNTNNGYTEFEDGKKIYCVKNRVVLFDGAIKHRAVKQTDTKTRIAININYVL